MADWIRAPKHRWFVNPRWVEYAFEAAKSDSTQWNSYYGSNKYIFTSPGLNSTDPNYRGAFFGECGLCEWVINCGWDTVLSLLCRIAPYIGTTGCNCNICPDNSCQCEDDGAGGQTPGGICENASTLCQNSDLKFPCEMMTCLDNFNVDCSCILPADCEGSSENHYWLSYSGSWVESGSEEAMCDPCDNSGGENDCRSYQPCPCGNRDEPQFACKFIDDQDICPAICCIPGEPGCIECVPGSGEWIPEDLCCTTCDDTCSPYGFPMAPEYCESCEYCNVYPYAAHCSDCCKCCETCAYIECEDVDELCSNENPPGECGDFSANCYECNGSYIPIWFECTEVDPCPNPFNPDCETGDEVVCYDYNTNDPIYYNASGLGATVIIEYDSPTAGSSYSYGNVATLCQVPDSLQLCVYLVNASGDKTKLVYNTDFTINETLAQITLDASLTVAGYTKVRFERCTDDQKMFLTFSEGAKLSATDVNASLHQLLFLIQEKEFASNTYYQVANDDGAGNPLLTVSPPTSLPINFDLATTNQNDLLVWDGNGSFVGQDPSVVAGNIQLDNLANISLTSVSNGDFLYYNGSSWVNEDFSTQVEAVVDVFDFKDWVDYQAAFNAALDDYYYASCDSTVDAKWAAADSCVLGNIPKTLVPNAITSFGIGYYAAEVQIDDQVDASNPSSAIQTYVDGRIAATLQAGGTILSNIRWEIGRTEGRGGVTGYAGYPAAYFDIEEFAYLNHGASDVLDDPANLPSTTDTGKAYYNPWTSGVCDYCRNKLYTDNIDSFKYSGDKSGTFAIGKHNTSSLGSPVNDRYLNALRSVITKHDWGTALGWTNEEHPLTDYPSASSSYPDYMGSDSLIYADYTYTDVTGTGDTFDRTKNVPAIVTYFLAQLWDSSSGAPSYIAWQGNMQMLGDITTSGIPDVAYTYLNTSGNYWYYWRWWVTGYDSDGAGASTEAAVGNYDTLSYYNPFHPNLLDLDGSAGDDAKYTILPASEAWDTDYSTDDEDKTMAKGGSYSLKIDANSVFSGLSPYLQDLYDEYVFEVVLDTDARITTDNCSDARCYEVVATIEKYIDGCHDGDQDCFQVGSGGTYSDGYHVYPDDFDADVLKAWDNYPYDKLGVEVRNKTGQSFDLVLKVPRLKRIGYIDVLKSQPLSSNDVNFRQLALDFVTDYAGGHWDASSVNLPENNSSTDTKNRPPEYQDMIINHQDAAGGSAMAFSVETAVQFIRLGIPSNIRISCYTVSTPQSATFSD